MDYTEFCHKLDELLQGKSLRTEGLETAINAIALAHGVTAGEVALLLADEKGQALRFHWPRGLQSSGSIPFSSKESLAARTFRDSSGTINNRFSSTRHSSIFEAVPLKEQGGKALPIQKIISVPLRRGEECLGVLQICRKAADAATAGPDFTREELRGVAMISQVVARYL